MTDDLENEMSTKHWKQIIDEWLTDFDSSIEEGIWFGCPPRYLKGFVYAIRAQQTRIEQLEAALRELSDGWECCAVSKTIKLIARAALEEKKNEA